MSLADLYRLIKTAKKRPKYIAVSTEIWNSLRKAGVIEMKTSHGFAFFRDTDKFPMLQGDICVLVNPALDVEKLSFVMPLEVERVIAAATPAALPDEVEEERRRPTDRRKGPRRKSIHLGREENRKSGPDRRKGPRRGSTTR